MNYEIKDLTTLREAGVRLAASLRELQIAEEIIFDSRLILAELAENVLRHAGCTAFVESRFANGEIELEVRSEKHFVPPTMTALPNDVFSEHGRGLYIVDRLAERRAVTPSGGICVYIAAYRPPHEEKNNQ